MTRVLHTLAELDEELAVLAVLQHQSFEQWMARRNSFRFHEDVSGLPSDPFSPEYRQAQVDLYCSITGQTSYDPWKAEPVYVHFDHAIDPYPYPFFTKEPAHIGNHFLQLGHIMHAMKEANPTAKSVIEYGCGSGFFTIMIAASGYDVTAVDINADCLRVLDALADARKLKVRSFNGTFLQAPDDQKYDLILFYEAFHHCFDFETALGGMRDRLNVGGAIIFANEAIDPNFEKPWGLRLEGGAVYETRSKGWYEGGFREDFFFELLRRHGFSVTKRSHAPTIDIFIARRV